jgi:hypothetical protein
MSAERSGYAKCAGRVARRCLRSPTVALMAHWTCQGLFYMDRTERWFKIVSEVVVAVVVGYALCVWLPWPIAACSGLLVAHTLNFLLNGQLWGVLKHYGHGGRPYQAFSRHMEGFLRRAAKEPSIARVVVCGSVAQGNWTPQSDLDARLMRESGLVNGLRACGFLLLERTRALYARFPLDVYVLDSETSLAKLSAGEHAAASVLPSEQLDGRGKA